MSKDIKEHANVPEVPLLDCLSELEVTRALPQIVLNLRPLFYRVLLKGNNIRIL